MSLFPLTIIQNQKLNKNLNNLIRKEVEGRDYQNFQIL